MKIASGGLLAAVLAILALMLPSLGEAGAGEKPLLTIAHCSDPHIAKDKGEYQRNFSAVIDYINKSKIDVVVITGDLVESPQKESFLLFKEYIKKLKPPVLYLPGNHDIGNKPSLEGRVTRESLSFYKKIMGDDHWHYIKNGVHLIGINSEILNSGFPEEEEQRVWLEKTLKGISSGEKVILFAHYPLFRNELGEAPAKGNYWTIDPPARDEILYLLMRYRVAGYFCGHLHIPMSKEAKGIKFVVAPAVSFSVSENKEDIGFNIIRVFPDKISLETIRIKDILNK
jgi:alkaline phosphatase D